MSILGNNASGLYGPISEDTFEWAGYEKIDNDEMKKYHLSVGEEDFVIEYFRDDDKRFVYPFTCDGFVMYIVMLTTVLDVVELHDIILSTPGDRKAIENAIYEHFNAKGKTEKDSTRLFVHAYDIFSKTLGADIVPVEPSTMRTCDMSWLDFDLPFTSSSPTSHKAFSKVKPTNKKYQKYIK